MDATRWSWQSRDNDIRVAHHPMSGYTSIPSLLSYVSKLTSDDVSFDDILVQVTMIEWTRPATPEELEERRKCDERHRSRMEGWERETLARLKAKYEPEGNTSA